jgi:hypothetical protein
LRKLKFNNNPKEKNIGFSENEINILIKELNIQNEVFINYLENAGKKSNIFDVDFLDANQYISLQNEFRKLIDNDSDINLKTNSICFFNYTFDYYNNKYFYFIKTDERLTNPNIFYYSNGEVPIGVNFRDERTEKIGIVDKKSGFSNHINYQTELKFGTSIIKQIKGYFILTLFFPFGLLLIVYFEIKKRY